MNNREYNSGTAYSSEKLAQEKAAESAYFLCYNFSVNDGMYPGQRQGQAGVTQGLPVAIGTGRRQSRYNSEYTGVSAYGDSLSRNSSRSPTTVDGSDVEQDLPASRKSSVSSYGSHSGAGAYHVSRPILYDSRIKRTTNLAWKYFIILENFLTENDEHE